ncbi:MAG TPA: O-antigen ligase family protein [Alphaproteobacteria bacterium]|jgi:O-antigen ligase|nr:O-antigen ligase family protein [Alphaproteobacteria bacterium]
MKKNVSIIKMVSVLSLFFSFTNFLPISVLISAFSLLLYPFTIAINKISRPIIPLLAFFAYAAVSTLFYDASAFFDFEFYRRDGNFFVTMTPLLFLSSTVFFVDLERTMRWFVYISTFANLCVLGTWVATGRALFRTFYMLESITPIYHFLFIAHNAAGGFLAILSAYSVAMLFERRNMLTAGIAAVNLAGLFLTSSRGSMLGLAAAIFLVVFAGKLGDKVYRLVIPALALNLLIVLYIYSNSDINYIIYTQTLLTKVVATLDPSVAGYLDDNASIRLETSWPLALHAFLQSPILGIGFGAYDDLPWKLWGWPGVFAFNAPEQFVHSDAHAHHTYLHVMAEMGAVGLVLLLWALHRLNEFTKTIDSPMVRRALLLGFWVNVVSSFTEHRLFTPSQMLPYVIMLGLAFAQSNYVEAQQRRAPRTEGQPALAGVPGR